MWEANTELSRYGLTIKPRSTVDAVADNNNDDDDDDNEDDIDDDDHCHF